MILSFLQHLVVTYPALQSRYLLAVHQVVRRAAVNNHRVPVVLRMETAVTVAWRQSCEFETLVDFRRFLVVDGGDPTISAGQVM